LTVSGQRDEPHRWAQRGREPASDLIVIQIREANVHEDDIGPHDVAARETAEQQFIMTGYTTLGLWLLSRPA
jgi:hypothetical protein